MLENIRGDSWGTIPPLRMLSLLPHDLCHEWNASPAPGRKPHLPSSDNLILGLGSQSFMEKAMATHSSALAWKIPWMEEPGRLQFMGSLSQTWLSDFTFHFHFHALEKEMATHSSVLAWRIPGTGEPAGLPSVGSHRVGRDWSDLAAAAVNP